MNQRRFGLPAAALAALLLNGCASLHETQSGFLMEYRGFKAVPGDRHELADIRTNVSWDAYRAVEISRVSMNFCEDCEQKLSRSERDEVAVFFERDLRKVFGKDRAVVDRAGPGTFRIRAAVTQLATSSTLVNLVAAALVWPVDYGGVTVEMEAVDSLSGERLAAVIGYFEGTPIDVVQSFFKLGHAREGIDKWVRVMHAITVPKPAP